MNVPTDEQIASLLVPFLSDGFNRSVGALQQAGAIDTRKMRTEYRGVGSKYYDLVTEQIELTAKIAAPALRKFFEANENRLS